MSPIKSLPIFFLILMPTFIYGELYKHTDADGITTYTDIETVGAEKITIPEGNTISLPKYVPNNRLPKKEQTAVYSTFLIISPENNSTIRNSSVSLVLSITPELSAEHKISAYLDNQITVTGSASLTLSISGLTRGSHSIYAVVLDSNGSQLIQSSSITLHVKQRSILH